MSAKVLIVDDEKEFAAVLSERLTVRGYETRFCFGGQEALDILAQENLDVVILDLIMPKMDGLEALRQIKRIRPLSEVIMLSGKATLETAIVGMHLGAFDYLTKPCEIEIMTTKINEAYLRKFTQEERIRNAKKEIELMKTRGDEAAKGALNSP